MVWMYAVSALCLFVCLPFFMHYKKKLRYHLASSYKALGTLCAACLAMTAAIRLDPRCWVCFAALVLHSAADYLLEFNFYFGTGFFLAGHICYIAFFTMLVPVSGVHLIVALCLLAVTAFLFWRWRNAIGKRMALFAVYGAVLSIMCACAVACLTGHTLHGLLTAAGGALFYLSDAMLLARLLFSSSRSADWAIMITYYAAQLLFGAACLM